MSTPRDTHDALSDTTNIRGMLSICMYAAFFMMPYWYPIYVQTLTIDDKASRKTEEKNMQQQKRQAEMSSEQREEINRRQREYRARKKAGSQISTTSCAFTETVPTSSPTGT